jgi:hypothetical protein
MRRVSFTGGRLYLPLSVRSSDFNRGWTCEHRGGHHSFLSLVPRSSSVLVAGLSSLAPRFAFLREWRRLSASTSLATVEIIGPSSEASAASHDRPRSRRFGSTDCGRVASRLWCWSRRAPSSNGT